MDVDENELAERRRSATRNDWTFIEYATLPRRVYCAAA
jgi:hypothetical protein